MFYAHIVLAKKGPLARIWLAAHWDKKLTKAHVFETNIEQSVDGIMQPKVKLALRTSGHLLLGVVRIYSRKAKYLLADCNEAFVKIKEWLSFGLTTNALIFSRKAKYLLADCNEAFVKIKMAFRPGMVDLPEGHREANVNAITLPEVFHDFDTALPELNDIDLEAQFSINQSRADEITMREDYGSLSMSLHDDGFGDMGFDADAPDIMRGGMDPNVDEQLFEREIAADLTETKVSNVHEIADTDISNSRLDGDGFGDEFGQPELFEGDLFGETSLAVITDKEAPIPPNAEDSDEDGDHFDTGAPSPISSTSEYHPTSPIVNEATDITITNLYNKSTHHKESKNTEEDDGINGRCHNDTEDVNTNNVLLEQTTLLQNEDESFALAPVDASAYKGVTKSKRKRKLIVDEIKNISGEEMKAQLANTADIVTTLDLAPPTKRLMYWKETGGVEKLFALPSRSIPARTLFANYQRHLISHFSPLEDFACLGPADLLALDHNNPENDSPSIIQNKRGRKRKQDVHPIPQPNLEETSAQMVEVSQLSLAQPECVRNFDSGPTDTHASLDLGVSDDLVPPQGTSLFDTIRSPSQMFSINDLHGLDNMSSLNDIPLTPGNLNQGVESNEERGLTPSELNHANMTPHHSTIETIESIPNLPVDQVSSILNEAENMPDTTDFNVNRTCDIVTDWNDYDFPPSVGAHNISDEQMENETDEQFEERVLNKRAAQMFFAVKNRIHKQEYLLLSELTIRNSRKQAAQKFYSLLVLKKFRALNISQSEPYAEIIVSRGPLFENPKL